MNKLEIRADRQVVNNFQIICDEAGVENERLLRQVVVYLMYKAQKNVFNEGVFDPSEFASLFGISVKNLQRKVDPFQRRYVGEEQYAKLVAGEDAREQGRLNSKVFDSALENILYILQNKPLNFLMDKEDGSASLSVQFIEDFWSYRKGRKVFYYVVLSSKIDRNLQKAFLSIDLNAYITLSKVGLDDLYFALCNLRSALIGKGQTRTYPNNSPSFEFFCTKAGIPRVTASGNVYEPKYRKRDLAAAFGKINGAGLAFDVIWENDDNGRSYIPCIAFKDFFNFDTRVARENDKRLLKEAFGERLTKSLSHLYRQLYKKSEFDTLTEEVFYDWLHDERCDMKEKMVCLESFFLNEGEQDGLPDNIESLKREFALNIAGRKKVGEFVFSRPCYRPRSIELK